MELARVIGCKWRSTSKSRFERGFGHSRFYLEKLFKKCKINKSVDGLTIDLHAWWRNIVHDMKYHVWMVRRKKKWFFTIEYTRNMVLMHSLFNMPCARFNMQGVCHKVHRHGRKACKKVQQYCTIMAVRKACAYKDRIHKLHFFSFFWGKSHGTKIRDYERYTQRVYMFWVGFKAHET